MSDSYEDIINMPHQTSRKHPRMSMENRAAQFAPFAALTGFSDEVKETAEALEADIIIFAQTQEDCYGNLAKDKEFIHRREPLVCMVCDFVAPVFHVVVALRFGQHNIPLD